MSSDFFDFLHEREQFIPVRVSVLLDSVCSEISEERDKEDFHTLVKMLLQRFHFDYHDHLLSLLDDFVIFDPDRDTISDPECDENEKNRRGDLLIQGLRQLATQCNFNKLNEENLNRCLSLQPMGGLSVSVDTNEFQTFNVYYRGIRPFEIAFPFWQFWRRKKFRESLMFKRVFVLAHYRMDQGGDVVVKLFKDVPIENLKIIAPKVRFAMPIFDKLKVGGSFLGGLAATIFKILKLAVFTGQVLLFVAVSLILVVIKGVFAFMNSRTKYLQIYSSALYFQSLSNNRSAITSLVTMAEEQEVRECILAIFCLYMNRDRFMSQSELDIWIEQWLFKHYETNIDFEIDDALRKLSEKKIVQMETEGASVSLTESRYRFLPFEDILKTLDYDWDHFFDFSQRENG